jgi:Skp family chaperone for outer membrane proteins
MRSGRVRPLIGAALLAVFGRASVLPVSAQDLLTVPPPVLTLDQERLFNGSRIAEQVSAEVESRSTALAAENRTIEAELVAEELELTRRRPNLPPTEFRALADAFDEKVQRIRAEQDAKTRELQRMRDQERQNFIRTVSPVLAGIVRERGALLVLDRRSVILSADSIDITEEAIERINAQFDSNRTQDPPQTDPAPDAPAQTGTPETAPTGTPDPAPTADPDIENPTPAQP